MINIEKQLEDKDLMKIARSATSSFSSVLSEEEIESCILAALWKANEKYDESLNTKFTTFLYNGVRMECLTQRKFNLSNRNKVINVSKINQKYVKRTGARDPAVSINSSGVLEDPNNYNDRVDMLDEISRCQDPDLIFDRFYKNMTIKELAKKRGVCGETIRIRLKKNLKKLKNNLI